ncbi:MAG: YqaE/Pmp3 family membrane protein [Phycisphaerales bacterium]|nr:YqaE/Pmp3 family membrane protein [Phycisphaerales bacterium]
MADDLTTNKLLLVIIAILLPPLAVWLKSNSLGSTLLNLVLCLVFWLPGLLHALWVVLK